MQKEGIQTAERPFSKPNPLYLERFRPNVRQAKEPFLRTELPERGLRY